MRRFLPVVLPGLIIAAALATQWIAERTSTRAVRLGLAAAAIVALVGIPGAYTWPLRTSTSYVGMYDAFGDVCRAIPDGSAVLITTKAHSNLYQVPIRSFCGVPVSGIRDPDADWTCVIAEANEAWADRGVNMMIGYGRNLGVEPALSIDGTHQVPELTLTRRPHTVITHSYSIKLADADELDTSACTR
jgi:hypothetical protein